MGKNRRIIINRNGDVVRVQIYNSRNEHEKFFDAKAPADDPKKVELLLEMAFNKGVARPDNVVKSKIKTWWS